MEFNDHLSKVCCKLRSAGIEPTRHDNLLLMRIMENTVCAFMGDSKNDVRFEFLIGRVSQVPDRQLSNFLVSCLDVNRQMSPVSICLDVGDEVTALLTTSVRLGALDPGRIEETMDAFRRAIPMAKKIFSMSLA
jgi:hypothetical protein